MSGLKTVILAAGKGTRMKSEIPKVMHKVLDKPMISYIMEAADAANASEICVVIGHQSAMVEEFLSKSGCSFAIQKEQLGTGHAVMQAISFIDGSDTTLILYGDTPLLTEDTLKKLIKQHTNTNSALTFITTNLEDPTGYGRIVRDSSGDFLRITEHKDATDNEKEIKEINVGIYLCQTHLLLEALSLLDNNNGQGEYYLTDVLGIMRNNGHKISIACFDSYTEFEGVNSRVQLAFVTDIMKKRINNMHMENGITIVDPSNTYIGKDVIIGADTIIYPGNILEGKTVIGNSCVLGQNNKIVNSIVGDGCNIQSSVLTDSEIGNGVSVGPFAHLRPGTKIGNENRIGNFVEIKNSNLADKTKVSHLTYVGDCDAGKNVNFGCGAVTVNYDGEKKHRTTIEDDVFIGCNTNLIAPVTLKKGSYTAAGTTVTKEVPENNLAVGRARQVNLDNWRKK